MNMISRFNRKWTPPVKICCPDKLEYELVTIIEPISFNDDKKTIKEYKEIQKYVVRKTKWKDFIKSFDLGSPSEQVLNHIYKGTPLVTAHTLPAGDYRSETLLKSAEIVREMNSKGITLEMLEEALKGSSASVESSKDVSTSSGEDPKLQEGDKK